MDKNSNTINNNMDIDNTNNNSNNNNDVQRNGMAGRQAAAFDFLSSIAFGGETSSSSNIPQQSTTNPANPSTISDPTSPVSIDNDTTTNPTQRRRMLSRRSTSHSVSIHNNPPIFPPEKRKRRNTTSSGIAPFAAMALNSSSLSNSDGMTSPTRMTGMSMSNKENNEFASLEEQGTLENLASSTMSDSNANAIPSAAAAFLKREKAGLSRHKSLREQAAEDFLTNIRLDVRSTSQTNLTSDAENNTSTVFNNASSSAPISIPSSPVKRQATMPGLEYLSSSSSSASSASVGSFSSRAQQEMDIRNESRYLDDSDSDDEDYVDEDGTQGRFKKRSSHESTPRRLSDSMHDDFYDRGSPLNYNYYLIPPSEIAGSLRPSSTNQHHQSAQYLPHQHSGLFDRRPERKYMFTTPAGSPLSLFTLIPFHDKQKPKRRKSQSTYQQQLSHTPNSLQQQPEKIGIGALTGTTIRKRAQSFAQCLIPAGTLNTLPPLQETSTTTVYNPFYLDDPDLKTGKNRTVITLPCFMGSIIHHTNPMTLKNELNELFRQAHPDVDPTLTLSQIRKIKKKMYEIGEQEDLELSSIASAYVYFEKLILKNLVNKANRRLVAGVCLFLATKVNDPKELNYTRVLEAIDKILDVPAKQVLENEFSVYSSLDFCLYLPPWEVMPHLERILALGDYASLEEYLGEKEFYIGGS